MVQLTFSSFTHSKCCRLISATSRMISLSEIILQKNSWERRESNRGYWVRSANATSVLGCIPCSWCHYKACLERRLFSSSALGVAGFPYFGLLVTERTTSKMQPSDQLQCQVWYKENVVKSLRGTIWSNFGVNRLIWCRRLSQVFQETNKLSSLNVFDECFLFPLP